MVNKMAKGWGKKGFRVLGWKNSLFLTYNAVLLFPIFNLR
jgi:hypothetical protein